MPIGVPRPGGIPIGGPMGGRMPGGGPIMPEREKPQQHRSSACLRKAAENIKTAHHPTPRPPLMNRHLGRRARTPSGSRSAGSEPDLRVILLHYTNASRVSARAPSHHGSSHRASHPRRPLPRGSSPGGGAPRPIGGGGPPRPGGYWVGAPAILAVAAAAAAATVPLPCGVIT